jgi:hypothetical protein
MIVGAVGNLIKHSFSSIIIAVYMIMSVVAVREWCPCSNVLFAFSFGAATLAVEVRTPTEEQKIIIQRYASFMHSFLGRGVCESRSRVFGPLLTRYPIQSISSLES